MRFSSATLFITNFLVKSTTLEIVPVKESVRLVFGNAPQTTFNFERRLQELS